MRREQEHRADDESHGFDQTNGVVDLGAAPAPDVAGARERDRAVSGVAMLSTQKP